MTQQDKDLLLQDLCARLPYGVNVYDDMGRTYKLPIGNSYLIDMFYGEGGYAEPPLKPYLLPMSSMTEEEIKELLDIDKKRWIFSSCHLTWNLDGVVIDYLNKKMFDWRELIPKGLALPAPEGMYKTKPL